jgi:hypothetical protein
MGPGGFNMKLKEGPRPKRISLWLSLAVVLTLVAGYLFIRDLRPSAERMARLRQFWSDPEAYADWMIQAGDQCEEAPFLMPTDGFIGFLWGSSFRPGHEHQGIDVFGPSGPDGLGETPVVAAYAGYLSRLPDWRSSVIIRIPQDPLQPDRQIWTYYTHLADAEGESFILDAFPPGTEEVFVSAGTLLGYQGNYSADPDNPTGLHLHFSIVEDNGEGSFKNELEIRNTLDPSPYLGIDVNAETVGEAIVICNTH